MHDDFKVEIRLDGKTNIYHLKAVSLIEDFESKRTEVLNASMKLKFYDRTAYLNPGNFSGDEEKYRKFIDSSFAEIKEKESLRLIIDLRNNGGGDDSFSDYMVSYIADKPFKWCSSFSLRTSSILKERVKQTKDTTSAFWKSVLTHEDGEAYPYSFEPYQPQHERRRFKGEVYVLVNRQSYSQSTVTAAQIQDYNFGTIVGEETGEYPSLYASIFQYALPETGILVNVSKGYLVRVNGNTEERGVVPDVLIKDHLLDEKDEILEGLLKEINNSQ
jgi:C-terminal processing protease CtpA/Prc